MKPEQKQQLKEVCQLFGPSGHEDAVADYLIEKYHQLGYPIVRDQLGGVYAYKKSKVENAKRVFLSAHMDEVGFCIKKVLSNGNFLVEPLGGFNSETILASRAILRTKKGTFFNGYVAAIPPHLLKQTGNEKTPIGSMVFDFGFSSMEEVNNAGVRLGDPIILAGPFEELQNGKRILSKALDDRFGLAIGLDILKAFQQIDLPFDLIVGGVVQEEVGLRGSLVAAHKLAPDLAIVVDVSTAMDTDGSQEQGAIGNGVLQRLYDPGMIALPRLLSFQQAQFEAHHIPYQPFFAVGGTDATSIHKALDGIATLTYCIVARGIHTPSSLLDCNDYDAVLQSLQTMLERLDDQTIASLTFQDEIDITKRRLGC